MVKTIIMSVKTALGLQPNKPSLEKFLCIMHEQGYVCTGITTLPLTKKTTSLLVVLTRLDSELIFGPIEDLRDSDDLGTGEVVPSTE